MKKLSLFVTIIFIVAVLAMTTPAAANPNTPIGDRIIVWNTSIIFAENTPFHIWHGWVQPSTDEAIGIFDFELDVDGVRIQEDFKMFSATSGDPDTLWRLWVYNFPDGMTGTHTFTGHWYAPCQYAVDNLGYTGACSTPNEKVENNTKVITVTFVP